MRHYGGRPAASIAEPHSFFSIPCNGDPYEDVVSIRKGTERVSFKIYYVKIIPCNFGTRHDGEVVMFRMARRSHRLINAVTGDFELAQIALEW